MLGSRISLGELGVGLMAGTSLTGSEYPYSYLARQNPDGTWTVTVTRISGKGHRYASEGHTYTSAQPPSSPADAWRESGGPPAGWASSHTVRTLRPLLTAFGLFILIIVVIVIIVHP
jgi:hypothetical protein